MDEYNKSDELTWRPLRKAAISHKTSCLNVVDANDLVDPADEGRHFDVDAGHLSSTATESPANQTGQLVVAVVFAY